MNSYFLLIKCKQVFYICLLAILAFSSCTKSESIELYVSVDGNDTASGSLSDPFATIPRAVEVLRDMRESGNSNPATIFLREGRHQLNETLVLGVEDGITSEVNQEERTEPGAGANILPAHLTFAAYRGKEPVISAGVPVTGWERLESAPLGLPAEAAGKVWVADMPNELERFHTLYDGQGRLHRARGDGFVPTKPGDRRTLHFPEGALRDWGNISDVQIHIRPSRAWVINMLPLASVDEEAGIAKTSVAATYEMATLPGYLQDVTGKSVASVWVENALDVLDEPGEWVVNTKERKIYLWPAHPGPDGTPEGILAPGISELIRVEGDINYEGPTDEPVRGIAFRGLTFAHGDRKDWGEYEQRQGWGLQHDWDMFDRPTAMLRFRGAEHCRVTNSRFINAGGSGIRLDLHAQRNRIENSEFAHLGEAGILLAGYGPGTKDLNHHNSIINNHIHHFSEISWHSPGLWAWQSGHNHMANNYIHHSGYSAVLITNRVEPDRSLNGEGGRTIRHHEIPDEVITNTEETYENWKLREQYYHSRHNVVEYNEITHSVQLLSDGNGIYVSGAGTGNNIRYNYLHDNMEHHLPALIRCDDDQHETLIYGNVVYNNYAFAAGIVSKGVNDIVNNFIVSPQSVPRFGYISLEWYPVTGSRIKNNIIISHPDGGNPIGERIRANITPGPELETTEMDSNLYYHPTDPDWADAHLEKMQSAGNEQHSLFGDPMFVDPENGNFGFKEGSPARELGIEPLDVSKMGMQ